MFIAKMALALNAEGEHHLRRLLKDEETILKPEVYKKLSGFFDSPDEMLTREGSVLRLWDVNLEQVQNSEENPKWFYLQRFIDYLMNCLSSRESRFIYLSSYDYEALDKGEMDLGPFETKVKEFIPVPKQSPK